ncbi:ATP-binding cassette domain-containing protein [Streptomyces sp. NPDC101118]|uniref:ATP-binding cassette domain-containing protein n=1 Tax=Streptomyces sp. NPDC101118 TaxID=3366109 RepID=UPI0037F25D37
MLQAIGLTSAPRKDLPPAVDDLTFEACPGRVTALLGEPGAGKTTALRLMLELEPGRGVTYFRGRPLHRIPHPAREVGVLLGDVPGHPARTVRGQLRMLCAAVGVPASRADTMLEVVGISGLRDQRLGSLSLGMDRRVGLAAALLADPCTLLLDEPSAGLSPRDQSWLYRLLRGHAELGGAVLFTTSDAKEAARSADRVVSIAGGRLVADQEAADFARTRLRPRVAVRTPHAARLAALLGREARAAQKSVEIVEESGSRLSVYGSSCAEVGETAFRHGVLVHQLADETGDSGPTFPRPTPTRDHPSARPTPAAGPLPASATADASAPHSAAGGAQGPVPGPGTGPAPGSGTARASSTMPVAGQGAAQGLATGQGHGAGPVPVPVPGAGTVPAPGQGDGLGAVRAPGTGGTAVPAAEGAADPARSGAGLVPPVAPGARPVRAAVPESDSGIHRGSSRGTEADPDPGTQGRAGSLGVAAPGAGGWGSVRASEPGGYSVHHPEPGRAAEPVTVHGPDGGFLVGSGSRPVRVADPGAGDRGSGRAAETGADNAKRHVQVGASASGTDPGAGSGPVRAAGPGAGDRGSHRAAESGADDDGAGDPRPLRAAAPAAGAPRQHGEVGAPGSGSDTAADRRNLVADGGGPATRGTYAAVDREPAWTAVPEAETGAEPLPVRVPEPGLDAGADTQPVRVPGSGPGTDTHPRSVRAPGAVSDAESRPVLVTGSGTDADTHPPTVRVPAHGPGAGAHPGSVLPTGSGSGADTHPLPVQLPGAGSDPDSDPLPVRVRASGADAGAQPRAVLATDPWADADGDPVPVRVRDSGTEVGTQPRAGRDAAPGSDAEGHPRPGRAQSADAAAGLRTGGEPAPVADADRQGSRGAQGVPGQGRYSAGGPRHARTGAPVSAVRRIGGPLRPWRYELRRAFGTAVVPVVTGAATVLSVLITLLLARGGHVPQTRLLAAWPSYLPLPPAALAAGLLGALAFGEEYRFPALAADRGTVPRRLGLLLAKLGVSAGLAVVLGGLAVTADAAALRLVFDTDLISTPADWLSPAVSWAGLLVGCAWAGVLASGVFRSATAGVAAVLAVPVLVVPLVRKVFDGPSAYPVAGLSARLRGLAWAQWPPEADRLVMGALRVMAQPVGTALVLSLTVLMCAYGFTGLRSRVRW